MEENPFCINCLSDSGFEEHGPTHTHTYSQFTIENLKKNQLDKCEFD